MSRRSLLGRQPPRGETRICIIDEAICSTVAHNCVLCLGDNHQTFPSPGMMSSQVWTDAENDLIVWDYFALLADDVAGRPYKKAQQRPQLLLPFNNRSDGPVEFKHQSINVVLKALGVVWLTGCKPAFNFMASVISRLNGLRVRGVMVPTRVSCVTMCSYPRLRDLVG